LDVFEAIRNRRSIRRYKAEPVPDEKVTRVLEAARLAPSASNRQEYKFIIVRDKETKEKLVPAAAGQGFLAEADTVIAGCAMNPERRWHAEDVTIAIDHMTLAAYALGLGTCWIGAFEEEAVKSILGVPEDIRVVMLLTLGVPAEEGRLRPRKSVEELVCYDRWQD